MVHSVSAISTSKKIDRDTGHSNNAPSEHSFTQILKDEIKEQKKAAKECRNTTYGSDMRLHTFLYQPKEYTL